MKVLGLRMQYIMLMLNVSTHLDARCLRRYGKNSVNGRVLRAQLNLREWLWPLARLFAHMSSYCILFHCWNGALATRKENFGRLDTRVINVQPFSVARCSFSRCSCTNRRYIYTQSEVRIMLFTFRPNAMV